MITIEEVKVYLGIDYADEGIDKRLEHLIKVSSEYLKGSIGGNFDLSDYRAKELALIVISDLYDNHDLNAKVSGTVRMLVNDFSLQLRMEMRRKNGI